MIQVDSLVSYHQRRSYFIELLGGVCAKCGTNECLEFDHTDPATKLFDVSQRLTARMEIILPEIKKCQLLCSGCHKEKTLDENGRAQHGTESTYSHGCRCIPCLEAHRTYGREYARRNADRLNSQRRERRRLARQ